MGSLYRGTGLGRSGEFVGDDFEVGEASCGAEAGDEGDVAGVAAARHGEAADAGGVEAGVEGEPGRAIGSLEEDLEPSGEVHGGVDGGEADVAEISGAVAGGDIEAAAEGYGGMGEVAADALFFVVGVAGGLAGAGEFVAEGDAVVDVVADGLDAGPAGAGDGAVFPGFVLHEFGFAEAAGEDVDEDVVGEILDGDLGGFRNDRVRLAAVLVVEEGGDEEGAGGGRVMRWQRLPKPSV